MSLLKTALTYAGAALPKRAVCNLNASLNYLEVGRWLREQGVSVPKRVGSREDLFRDVGAKVANQRVLYLEFGVYRGAATRCWSSLLLHPESHLHGFDSFQGLPEAWAYVRPAGDFDMQGAIPHILDPRVAFFKGWFSETLPHYRPPAHDILVVNMDADLYSSTAYVLEHIESLMVPGTYLYFDEFQHREHELRAFQELLQRTGWKFRVVGATRELSHVMFQRL